MCVCVYIVVAVSFSGRRLLGIARGCALGGHHFPRCLPVVCPGWVSSAPLPPALLASGVWPHLVPTPETRPACGDYLAVANSGLTTFSIGNILM